MVHELKIWPQYYEAVISGDKTFEYRLNDRGYQKGDSVFLNEWCPEDQDYTEKSSIEAEITYVLPVTKNMCVFSFKVLNIEQLIMGE